MAHSLHPVPFGCWNGRQHDSVRSFSEDAACLGAYGRTLVSHLAAMRLLSGGRIAPRVEPAYAAADCPNDSALSASIGRLYAG